MEIKLKEINGDHNPILKKEDGWQGNDSSLLSSLGDYGFIWRRRETKKDWEFWYRDGEVFNTSSLGDNWDMSDFDWVDFESVSDCFCMVEEEFLNSPFPQQICMLHAYYGAQNVFGCSYETEGYKIVEED